MQTVFSNSIPPGQMRFSYHCQIQPQRSISLQARGVLSKLHGTDGGRGGCDREWQPASRSKLRSVRHLVLFGRVFRDFPGRADCERDRKCPYFFSKINKLLGRDDKVSVFPLLFSITQQQARLETLLYLITSHFLPQNGCFC